MTSTAEETNQRETQVPRVFDGVAWRFLGTQQFLQRGTIPPGRLVALREARGFSSVMYAARGAPFTYQALHTWEIGKRKPRPESVCELAIHYRVPVRWLLGED